MLVGLFLAVILVFSVTVNYAFADRFSEWIEIWKKWEELKAKEYQKKVLNFDYEKIQSKDKGFKSPIISDVKKKHIQNEKQITFKVIKNLNN